MRTLCFGCSADVNAFGGDCCNTELCPTPSPTKGPTATPTAAPTAAPTSPAPTDAPTSAPTSVPTQDSTGWFLGSGGSSCTATCTGVGRVCNSQRLLEANRERTTTEAQMQTLAGYLGVNCVVFDYGWGSVSCHGNAGRTSDAWNDG